MSDRPEPTNPSRSTTTGSTSGLNDDVWAYIMTGNRSGQVPGRDAGNDGSGRSSDVAPYRTLGPGTYQQGGWTIYVEPGSSAPGSSRQQQRYNQNQDWAGAPRGQQRYDQTQDWAGNPRFREPQVYQQHPDRYRGRRPGDNGSFDQGYNQGYNDGYNQGYRDAQARMQQQGRQYSEFDPRLDPRAYSGTYREREMQRHPERYRRRESSGYPSDVVVRPGRGPGMTDSEFQSWRNGNLSVPPRSSVYDQYDQYPNNGISYEEYRQRQQGWRNRRPSARDMAAQGIAPPNYREDRYGQRYPVDGYPSSRDRYAHHERDQYGRDRYGRNGPYDGQNQDWANMCQVMKQMVGRPIYEFVPGLNPELGCAGFVSFTLKQSLGLPINDQSVAGLERSLQRNGYVAVPLEEAQPGDVIIGKRGAGRHGHAAIKAAGNATVANSSIYGVIRPNTVDAFYSRDYVSVVAYRRAYA